MTENTLVKHTTETQEFKNPIAVKFFELYSSMRKAYLETGVVPSDSIREIIGNPPRIPDSPDTDARLEAYEDLVAYNKMRENIEAKVKGISAEKKGA